MTREDAIEKVIKYIIANSDTGENEIRCAFMGHSPMRGALMMLECFGLIELGERLGTGGSKQ